MQKILDDTTEPAKGEMHVAALTAGQRKNWALARHNFFSKGINRTALDVIEKAAFVVCLDDIEYNFDPVSFLPSLLVLIILMRFCLKILAILRKGRVVQ